MPPRYAYWTILAGGLPTAFRAADRDELLPTFRRLHERHPDAVMKWFARGRLWDSPEAAREVRRPPREPRGRDWRPGGEHRDARQKFRDARKDRNLRARREKFANKRRADARRDAPGGESPAPARRRHTERSTKKPGPR